MTGMRSSSSIKRVAILGLGLMGGSLGMALKARARTGEAAEMEVIGWNRTRRRCKEAIERGVVDSVADSIEDAASGADLVVVATPVSTIADLLLQAASVAPDDAVLTDVGSVKGSIVEAVEAELPAGRHFVGGHPMCGSELAGLDAARSDLYEGATWVLTPTERTDSKAFGRLQVLIKLVGARVVTVDPYTHDEFVAVVSHLPHLVAASLLNVAAAQDSQTGGLLQLAAGGFRDVTRIASGNPNMWSDICRANRDAICTSLNLLSKQIDELRSAIATGRREEVTTFLGRARDLRAALPVPGIVGGDLYRIVVPVRDRPGVLADISTTVGRMGINIEDIGLTHSLEGSDGVLELFISSNKDALRVIEVLREKGYKPAIDAEDEISTSGGTR